MRFFNALLLVLLITILCPGCIIISQGTIVPFFLVIIGLLGLGTNYTSGRDISEEACALQQAAYESDCTPWGELDLDMDLEGLFSQEGLVIHDALTLMCAHMGEEAEAVEVQEENRVAMWKVLNQGLLAAMDGVIARNSAEIDAMQRDAELAVDGSVQASIDSIVASLRVSYRNGSL